MLRPLTHLMTVLANRAFAGSGLARFTGRHFALCVAGKRYLWRIDAAGALQAVHPLVQADCTITIRLQQGGVMHISGDGEMLAFLSERWRQVDGAALFAELCGERAAPLLLATIERARYRAEAVVLQHAVPAPQMDARRAAVRTLAQRVDAFAKIAERTV